MRKVKIIARKGKNIQEEKYFKRLIRIRQLPQKMLIKLSGIYGIHKILSMQGTRILKVKSLVSGCNNNLLCIDSKDKADFLHCLKKK